jgi:protein translocase SecG subunit
LKIYEIIFGVLCILVSIAVIGITLMTEQNSKGLSAALDGRSAYNAERGVDFKKRALNRAGTVSTAILLALVFVLNIIAARVV